MKARSEYNILLDLGELEELYPNLTGVWKQDKEIFTCIWEQNQEILKSININSFDEY